MPSPYEILEYGFKFDFTSDADVLYAWTECFGVRCDLEGGSMATVAAQSAASWNAWEALHCVECGRKLCTGELVKGYNSEGYCVDCWYDKEEAKREKGQRMLKSIFGESAHA